MVDQREDFAPTLPNEVLSFIFREFVSNGRDNPSFLRPDRTNVPLNLSWVNSQWRRVAISTPELWTSIALPNERARRSNPTPNPTNGDAELLKLYISRSGDQLPLSFALDYGGIRTEESTSVRREVVEAAEHIAGIVRLTLILDNVRHRWRSMIMRCRAFEVLSILLSSLVIGAPLLEHLIISTTPSSLGTDSSGIEGDVSREGRLLDLACCPKLSSVVLQCPRLRLNPFILDDGPMENLNFLALNSSPSQKDAFTWLQCSVNLVTLSLNFINAPRLMLPHAFPLVLPRLNRFKLCCLSDPGQEPSDPASFLHLLTLPALRSFELVMDESLGSGQGWPHVLELLRRSGPGPQNQLGPPLEELEILGTPMTEQELLEILVLVPKLKKLTIDDGLTSDAVIQQLGAPSYSRMTSEPETGYNQLPLCPELQLLVCHACQASLPVLASMVDSRYYRISTEGDSDNQPDASLQDGHREQAYRTLRGLILMHSYKSQPPASENPAFRKCQDGGLQIVQRPLPAPMNDSQDHMTISSVFW